MHILVIYGGTSNEREVSLRSGQSVADAIENLGYSYTLFDPQEKNLVEMDLTSYNIVFIALHGAGGEDGTLQKILEDKHVPFVGSGSEASALCSDKFAYKQLLKSKGLPVVDGKLVSKSDMANELFRMPYVLKPFNGGSSLDTQIVRVPDETARAVSLELLSRYEQMLLEPLIEGTEITVGILGDRPLPVIEIIPPHGKEFDYENKYNGSTQELCPPQNVSQPMQKQAQELALKVHIATGCRHMSRTDIIIDQHDNLHILETNTIPGLTTQSLFPKMMQTDGMTMAEGIDKLLKMAL